jgi:ribosomal protein S18 acetylase RimI-like enzyme
VGEDGPVTRPLLHRVDAYLDAAPRSSCTVEEVGPFTLFIGATGGWRYYARPRHGIDVSGVTAGDVIAVTDRQRALEQPMALEWVEELAPEVATACRDAGLSVHAHPLLVHHEPLAVPVPDGVRIRRLSADDAAVAAALATAQVGFTAIGTDARGGVAERDAAASATTLDAVEHARRRILTGRTVVVVAEDERGVLACGSHNPVDDATEIVGVATLPDERRRGLGGAVTNTLVADAIRRGIQLILLSAQDDDVARVYERVGFVRVGTAAAAAPEEPVSADAG